MEKILVIGAAGQIGSELVLALRKKFGNDHVFATDIKEAPADVILKMIAKDGLNLAGTIPDDHAIYEFDLNGRPTIEMPEDSKAVQAAFEIFEEIIK